LSADERVSRSPRTTSAYLNHVRATFKGNYQGFLFP
jgi:hypothetical protein